MQITIINQMSQSAFLQYGDAAPTGTYNSSALTEFTPYSIAANGTLTGMSLTDFESGKMYFSLGTALTWPSAGDPDFQYNSGDPNWMIRWDKLELSLYSNTSLVSVANLTATDFFGIRLQLQTFGPGSSTPLATLTTRDTTANVFGDIAAIANHDTANFNSAVVPVTVSNTVATGVAVPGVGNVLRVIAPSSVPPPAVDDYVSPQAYVTAVQTGSIVTNVTGNYSVQGGSGATQSQSYDFLASIGTGGSIIAPTETIIAAGTTVFNTTTINLNGALVMTGSLGVLGANQTIIVQSGDLINGIISQNPPFYFMNSGTLMYDTFAANDVYGAAVRDILAGFGFGFVGSTAINPNTGHQYVNDPTNNWYNPQRGLGVAYSYAQPVNSTFYSQYAAVFAQNVSGTSTYQEMSDAYGFPFTDLLGAPLTNINPNTVSSMTITILADDAIAACYAAGTPIMTTLGEVPIEQLTTGMAVPTLLDGSTAAIRWIGYRHVDCRRHPRPEAVRPVRIRRDAFGFGRPHCDVVLSPDHAVYVDGVLVPVRHLVNGQSIVPDGAEEVTYYHVELDRHDVILAAGLPAETYLDTGNRSAFANGGSVVMVHPDFQRLTWEGAACAPMVVTGPALEAIRTWLDRQGEIAATAEPEWMGWMRTAPSAAA